MRPKIKLLSDSLIEKIIEEAFFLLERKGVIVENRTAIELLKNAGANVDQKDQRVFIPKKLVEESLKLAPSKIEIYDRKGEKSFFICGDNVHFDPGSAALNIFDYAIYSQRKPFTSDLVAFSRVTEKLENLHFQSTGIVSSDVPEEMADFYRLFIGLQYCKKPIVTGTFVVESFEPMYEMLKIIRGGAESLREKPLAIFDACPSPPLKWSNLTTQSVIDCARAGIPSEFVSMPLAGATAPVTLSGALVQHTAENLAGVVIAQLSSPGAPIIYGGSPSIFDMRKGTTPMGAIETMMIDCAYSEIGKKLGLPTHAYMGLSDSKCVDAQAGLESGIGIVLSALAGINVVSGVGMLDFENCQSLEKLVVDNDICGMALRLISGIEKRDEPIATSLFMELGDSPNFLTSPHTKKWFRIEHTFPPTIDRGTYEEWEKSDKKDLWKRAHERVKTLLSQEDEESLPEDIKKELEKVVLSYGKKYELEKIPDKNIKFK
ncbi:MAG: trimethylamine methyltransferase family protein [Candidatus Aminicenantia bacterium]